VTVNGYTCATCGGFHAGLPLAYGAAAPLLWESIPENEREERGVLTSDLCAVDKEHFFILGRLEIPIIDEAGEFSWNVWVSLSKDSFKRVTELWDTEGREKEPPYFGWLSTSLPCYPDTLNLKAHVHTRSVGMRPYVELEPTDHPLAVEQRTGISIERVQEIAECVLHS